MSNAHKELYEFDKFRLDVSERILWRETERVPLSEKAFDTLCALVRRGNHLVGKDELLAEIWADAVVEENNLDKNISLLRQVLGERAGEGKFIETVRGHGFRFVPFVQITSSESQTPSQVESEIESPESIKESESETEHLDLRNIPEPRNLKPETRNRRPKTKNRNRKIYASAAMILLISVGAALYLWRQSATKNASVSPFKTVAVLPFKPLVAENRNEALEMGMADTLISKLGSGEEITVRPLSSVRRYAAALELDSSTAGRELGVEAVLDGTIQTSGERIRISARLMRTGDGKQLWAERFDEKFTDIFAVQDSISERVATALKIRLGGAEKKHYTENVEAYQLYMKGRFHSSKIILPETEKGIEYYNQAIAVDPGYALAYAGLADAYRSVSLTSDVPPWETMPKGKAAARRAIELDETLAEARAALGFIVFFYDWDWQAAEGNFRRGLELDSDSADLRQSYAHLLSNIGRHEQALFEIKLSRELEPLNLRTGALEGQFLLHAGQTDAALDRLQKTIDLDPNFWLAHLFAASAYIEKGMFEKAFSEGRKAKRLSPSQNWSIAFGGYALAKAGKQSEARAVLDELLGLSKTRYVPPYHFALIYNALGEGEKALDYLEKGFAEKDVRMVFLKVEPKWNNLRSEPRFVDLMRRMNFE
jgi:TolB-like protein/DNA-binding winged helix-turn-helix (wHTH) protein